MSFSPTKSCGVSTSTTGMPSAPAWPGSHCFNFPPPEVTRRRFAPLRSAHGSRAPSAASRAVFALAERARGAQRFTHGDHATPHVSHVFDHVAEEPEEPSEVGALDAPFEDEDLHRLRV